ncbi:MAG: ribonuclease P protein component [Massiliimalia sp.]|jgi:ribonuclease P protein component
MKNLPTLKLNKEFKRAYFQGKFKANPLLVTYMVKNRLGYHRVGITTSKKIGTAVLRSRARRVIRAAFVQIRDELTFPAGYDIVFVARPDTAARKSYEVAEVMKKQLSYLLRQPDPKRKGRR